MPSRRAFLAGMMASGLCPTSGWADLGAPCYLSAARNPDGQFALYGLSDGGELLFQLPLPDRGHAAAAHPFRAEAVGFARRPGRFAIVLDCRTGERLATLNAPAGRHFYGHGAFSADGKILLTTENDYEAGEGRISLWDAANGYTRLGSFPSGGVGPHDMRLMPNGETLVIANGGIETHPESGRTKLNIPVMQPNLTYLDLQGRVLEVVELDRALHKNSIRHLAVRKDGLVAFAMQWQGSLSEHPPLLGLHRRGQRPVLAQSNPDQHAQTMGYAGSVAFSEDGTRVAFTSPRGGVLHVFDADTGAFLRDHTLEDVCGLAHGPGGFSATSGTGQIVHVAKDTVRTQASWDVQWDNHLIPVQNGYV